jgi:hypothetical protein
MDFRPLRGKRGVDQFMILAIPIALAGASGAGGLVFYRQRLALMTEKHVIERQSYEPPTRIAYGLTPRALDGTYQGEITRKDKQSSWATLQIRETSAAEDDRVVFRYELNAMKRRETGVGDASLAGKWIRFGGMQGQIVLSSRGVLTFRSMPRDVLPRWSLEAGGVPPETRSAE